MRIVFGYGGWVLFVSVVVVLLLGLSAELEVFALFKIFNFISSTK